MRNLRLLKFDSMHPRGYFDQLRLKHAAEIKGMDRKEYLAWILSKRSNYSDFYTYNLNQCGWTAEEFLVTDEHYLDLVSKEIMGGLRPVKSVVESAKNAINPVDQRWEKKVVREYIRKFKPDVILVRENSPFEASFWGEFSSSALIVDRIAMNIPWGWSPTHFDLIFTSMDHYKQFFESNDIPTRIFYDAFDARILNEIDRKLPKQFDVSHAGGLGATRFAVKTKLFEFIAENTAFHWWGWSMDDLSQDSPLHKVYRGFVSGLEMYQIYHQSKIVLNDYGSVAKGVAVNQRIFEVMGVGALLLTREAENLKTLFPADVVVTFKDNQDCLDKINYFLKNEAEREDVAKRGQQFILENFNYAQRMQEIGVVMEEYWTKKFKA